MPPLQVAPTGAIAQAAYQLGAKQAHDKRLPNNGPELRWLFTKLRAKHGTVLVVVGQPASPAPCPSR